MEKAPASPASPLGKVLYYSAAVIYGVGLAGFGWNLIYGDILYSLLRCDFFGTGGCPEPKPHISWIIVFGCIVVGFLLVLLSFAPDAIAARTSSTQRPRSPSAVPKPPPSNAGPTARSARPMPRTGQHSRPSNAQPAPASPPTDPGVSLGQPTGPAPSPRPQPVVGRVLADPRFNGLIALSSLIVSIVTAFK